MPKKPRRYDIEYAQYQGTKEQLKRRAERNAARAKMEKLGKVRKGDGLDVHHTDNDTSNNKLSNLKVLPKSKNRSKK